MLDMVAQDTVALDIVEEEMHVTITPAIAQLTRHRDIEPEHELTTTIEHSTAAECDSTLLVPVLHYQQVAIVTLKTMVTVGFLATDAASVEGVIQDFT